MVDKLPNYAIHPGVILRQYLKDEKITKASFSKKTGVNSATLNKILRGKGSISNELAVLFERGLNIRAPFWNNLQAIYNEAKNENKRRENKNG